MSATATRKKLPPPAEFKKIGGERHWLCPSCTAERWNPDQVFACQWCRKKVFIPDAGDGIPETEEEAVAKEEAALNESLETPVQRDDLLPGIQVNEHDVVLTGIRVIRVSIPKSTRISAAIRVAQVRAGDWATGYDFKAQDAGRSGPVSIGKHGTTYATEDEAVADEFRHFGEFLDDLLKRHPNRAKIIKQAREAAELHRQRIFVPNAQPTTAEAPPAAAPKVSLAKAAKAAAAKPIAEQYVEMATRPPLAERVNTAPLEQIELAKISPSPSNNRKDFDKAALQELADSLASHGMLQPISVYRVAGEALELIFGERRYRAAKLAKLKVVPCRVIDCTTVEADELRLIENLKRKDLTAIEEAQGYQDLIAKHGYTQQKLAEQLAIHQSTIANRIRLLRLPAAWQQMVIAREISESHARGLVDFAEAPASVIEHMTKEIREQIKHDELSPVSDWPRWLYQTAVEVLREVEPGEHYSFRDGSYRSGTVLFTNKQLEQWGKELELVTLKYPYGDGKKLKRFAANIAKWDELHGGLEKAKAERAAKAAGAVPAQAKKGETRSPAEIAKQTKQLAEQYEKRVRIYWQKWVQRTAAARCETASDDKTIRLLLAFGAMNDRGTRQHELSDLVREMGGKRVDSKGHGFGWGLPLLTLMTVEGKKLLDLARKAIAGWLQHDVEGYETALDRDELPGLVELFGIDLAKEWRVDEEFLLLHTKAQLAAFWNDWKIKDDMPEKRGDVVAAILAADKAKRLPAPKVLLKGGK